MTKAASLALCAAIDLAAPDGGEVPDWVHLLPIGKVETNDSRGPYLNPEEDTHALIVESMKDGGRLVLDENHSTDIAAPKGQEAPARGWIVDLQARADGIWGKVEWTPEGRRRVADREYRGISPVIAYRARDKKVTAIRRASLVNIPNLAGLQALHSEENDMSLKERLIGALGLGAEADDDAIVAAAKTGKGDTEVAAQSALLPIGKALGLADGADGVAILAGITSLQQQGDGEMITALQSELAELGTKFEAMQAAGATDKATAFVDGAIAAGHVGVKPLRDRYIAMHMKDAAGTEELIGALPKIAGTVAHRNPAKPTGELDAADKSVIALMGLDAEEFKKARLAEAGETEEAL